MIFGRRALPGAGWLAGVSFSLYLVHKPVFGLVERHLGDALQDRGFVAFAVYGIASLLAAAILYYLAERPGLLLRDQMLVRRASRKLAYGQAAFADENGRRIP